MPARVERFHMTSRRPYCTKQWKGGYVGVPKKSCGLNMRIELFYHSKRFFFGLKNCIAIEHVRENDLLLDPNLRRVFRFDEQLVTCYRSKLSLEKFSLARDQVVYLQTAGNLKNQSDWASDFPTSFPGFSPTRLYVPGTGRREPWERGW